MGYTYTINIIESESKHKILKTAKLKLHNTEIFKNPGFTIKMKLLYIPPSRTMIHRLDSRKAII